MRWPWQRMSPQAAIDRPGVAPAGWAFLPPLQRQMADEPPVVIAAADASWLPSRGAPQQLGTMGHLVTSAAPPGTVAGTALQLGAPVQRAVAADLTLRVPFLHAPSTRSPVTIADRVPDAGAPVDAQASATTVETRLPSASAVDTVAVSETPGVTDGADTVGVDAGADAVVDAGADAFVGADADADAKDVGAVDAGAGTDGAAIPAGDVAARAAEAGILSERLAESPAASLSVSLQRDGGTVPSPPPPSPPPPRDDPPLPRPRRLGLGAPLVSPASSGPLTNSDLPAISGLLAASAPPAVQRTRSSESAGRSAGPGLADRGDADPADAATGEPPSMGSTVVPPHELGRPVRPLGLGPPTVAPVRRATPIVQRAHPARTGNSAAPSASTSAAGASAAADVSGEPIGGPSSLAVADAVADAVARASADTGRDQEPVTAHVVAQREAEPSAPLIAQRALTPLLLSASPPPQAPARPPRATVLADTGAAPGASAATSDQPVGATPISRGPSVPDASRPSHGGFTSWLQRMVGAGPSDAGTAPDRRRGPSTMTMASTGAAGPAALTAPAAHAAAPGAHAAPAPAAPAPAAPAPALPSVVMRTGSDARGGNPDPAAETTPTVQFERAPAPTARVAAAPALGRPRLAPLPASAGGVAAWAHGGVAAWAQGGVAAWAHGAESESGTPLSGTPLSGTPLPVAANPAASVIAQREVAAIAPASVIAQRAGDEIAAPAHEPAPVPPARTAGHSEAPAASAAASVAAPAGAPMSPTALEALAGRLYDPLVRRLKTELLLDRERRGVRIDGL